MRKLFFILSTSICLLACTENNDHEIATPASPIVFSSTIHTNGARVIGTTWTSNDKIGIFMKRATESLSSSSILNDAANIGYALKNSSETLFYPIDLGKQIVFPDDKVVDFIAYYPFQEEMDGFDYKVDITNQTNVEAIDFMYSNETNGLEKVSKTVPLKFRHMLASVQFIVQSDLDLSDLKVVIEDVPTQGVFDLSKGEFSIDNNSKKPLLLQYSLSNKTAEALLLPIGATALNISFVLGEIKHTQKINNVDLYSGVRNYYTINLTNRY